MFVVGDGGIEKVSPMCLWIVILLRFLRFYIFKIRLIRNFGAANFLDMVNMRVETISATISNTVAYVGGDTEPPPLLTLSYARLFCWLL